MDNEYIREYLNGALDVASSVSQWMGPSYVRCFVSDNGRFDSELKKRFRMSLSDFTERDDIKFSDLIYEWLGREGGDGKLSSVVGYHITRRLGDPEKVYGLDEKALDKADKAEAFPFSFIEDGYAVRFRKKTVLFIIGNNE